MKLSRIFSVGIVLILLLVFVVPGFAQIGDDRDTSSITIQNISGTSADVQVTFIAENGTSYTPAQLDNLTPTAFPNPFTLVDGESRQIYVPNIPATELPSGEYAVVISSSAQIVAVAGIAGEGTTQFTGGYSGLENGASPFYLPSASYNYYGWDSMITVQNLGSEADVTVTITCTEATPDQGAVGTLTYNNLPQYASHTFDLRTTIPSGFTGTTQCGGSAIVTTDASQPVVATDFQTVAAGNSIAFAGAAAGSESLFVSSLSDNYYSWNSSLTIVKMEAGNTTATVTFTDGADPVDCFLEDTSPSCQLYMPNDHDNGSEPHFGAVITTSPAKDIAAVAGTSSATLAGAFLGVGSGGSSVAIPDASKFYYGWVSSITCQNVSSTTTRLHVVYDGYPGDAYDTVDDLAQGDIADQIYVPNESFLPAGYIGGVTITPTVGGAEIACVAGLNLPAPPTPGDWATLYNAAAQ